MAASGPWASPWTFFVFGWEVSLGLERRGGGGGLEQKFVIL